MNSDLLSLSAPVHQAYEVDNNGCWNWLGTRDRAGYGHIVGPPQYGERRAHRVAYAAMHGPIPPRHHIHHTCENKSCVNPDHLELKTHSAHLRDHKRATIAKLTEAQVDEIRERLAAGEKQLPLSREYGVTGRVIWQICNDVKWRDDPDAPRRPIKWERYCPECGTRVEGRHDKKFCTRECRRRYNSRHGWRRRNASSASDEERHDG